MASTTVPDVVDGIGQHGARGGEQSAPGSGGHTLRRDGVGRVGIVTEEPAVPSPSDAEPTIAAHGDGDVAASVVSMSERHPEGRDAAYLDWHVHDHLPEQYRLHGLRFGQRWVSTPGCRGARLVSEPPFDAVDHVVQYLFAEPVDEALDRFFPLGGALRKIGRMPVLLPRVQVGGWTLARTVAAPRVLVGASVLPWRPTVGVYVLIERGSTGSGDAIAAGCDALVGVRGVAGVWCWSGAPPRHERLDSTEGLVLTVCYLDDEPVTVASALAPVLGVRWDGGSTPVLAAPFELVVPSDVGRHLP
jgi:hypothetical protein